MATSTSNDDIIEKKASAPVATSCLVIACVALIGAIVFQLLEIGEYRSSVTIPATVKKGVAQDQYAKKDIDRLNEAVTTAITASSSAGEGDAGAKLDAGQPGTESSALKEAPPEEEDAGAGDAKAPAPKAAPKAAAEPADAAAEPADAAADAAADDAGGAAPEEEKP
jgi:hypothetical protein